MAMTESRSLGELLGGLPGDISNLFRTEIQLAKTEASEKAAQAVSGLVFMGIGGVLAIGAVGVLLSARATVHPTNGAGPIPDMTRPISSVHK